jgi:hypothetical protein
MSLVWLAQFASEVNIQVVYMHQRLTLNGVLKDVLMKEES